MCIRDRLQIAGNNHLLGFNGYAVRVGILSPLAYKKNNGLPYAKKGYADKADCKWSATTIIRILQDVYKRQVRRLVRIFGFLWVTI